MIASKANDHEGFYLLQNLLFYYSPTELQASMRQIFGLLFQRLSLSKTAKYLNGIIVFFCFYVVKIGPSPLVQLIDEIQQGMFGMLLERVFITDMAKCSKEMERKIVAVGVSKLLTECPELLSSQYAAFWPRLLHALIDLFERPPEKLPYLDVDAAAAGAGGGAGAEPTAGVDAEPGYQAAFSQLSFAQPKQVDHLAEISDARQFLASSLSNFSQQRPGEFPTLLAPLEGEYKQMLQKYCDQAGVRIA